MTQKIYVIAGPTAGGKSGLALQLAQEINGEIINADSLQVYQDLHILSARPDEAETRLVPHHLYGYLDCYSVCSVFEWLSQAKEACKNIQHPIFVGGTGMYIQALVDGISMMPTIDLDIRERVRQMPLEEVQKLVQDCKATDPQRLRRALEVQLSSGKTLAYFQAQPKIKVIDGDFKVFFLNPPRTTLYERCNQRFEQMIAKGAIDEVTQLQEKGATGGVLKAIGVSEISSFLKQEISLEQMIERSQLATRHYAKRQVTWFKHQLKSVVLLDKEDVDLKRDVL